MEVKVNIRHTDKAEFELTGGKKADSLNPKELLVYAAAQCAGKTVMTILEKERISPVNLEIEMSGDLDTDTVTAQSVFRSFRIVYNLECRTIAEHGKAGRAVKLANDKYCGTLQMLRRIAPVSDEISVVSTETAKV